MPLNQSSQTIFDPGDSYRIIGFEALGNTDAFQTATLELRLKQNGE